MSKLKDAYARGPSVDTILYLETFRLADLLADLLTNLLHEASITAASGKQTSNSDSADKATSLRGTEMKRLMIADDEPGIRSLVKMTLADDSFQIFEASDGNEALEMARKKRPHLLLLDVSMPGKSGFEVCRAIKDDPELASTVVVMLTALAQESDLQLGKEAGADDYFTKPFSPLALMRKVDEILGSE